MRNFTCKELITCAIVPRRSGRPSSCNKEKGLQQDSLRSVTEQSQSYLLRPVSLCDDFYLKCMLQLEPLKYIVLNLYSKKALTNSAG
jgi:hypothetical protein